MNTWLPLALPLLETRPATQACVLTGDGICSPFLHSLVLTLLLHTNQGITYISKKCTNRKCPRIRLPMRGKTPLKGGKVWEAALILSFFLVAARRHVIFTLISM